MGVPPPPSTTTHPRPGYARCDHKQSQWSATLRSRQLEMYLSILNVNWTTVRTTRFLSSSAGSWCLLWAMLRLVVSALLLLAPAAASAAQEEQLTPPPGFRDRSGLTELVFWQGVNGVIAGGSLAYAITGGAVERECDTGDMGGMMEASEACKDAVGRSSGIAALGLAAGIATPLLVTRGKD